MIKNVKSKKKDGKFSRREFMTTSALAGASFMIMKPSLVRGTQVNSRLEVGCIGLGGRGSLISKMLTEHAGYQLVAICDYFDEVVNEQGEQFGVSAARRYTTLSGYQAVVESELDAVFFETPPYCFPDHVTAGVSAGRHIYLAKPVACDVPGCLQILSAAEEAQKNQQVFFVDFQMPTDPHIIEVDKRIAQGDIGKVGLMVTNCGSNGFADPPFTENIESRLRNLIWVNDTELGCGYLGNFDIHAIDIALAVAGEPPVSAMGSSRLVRANPHGDSHDVYSVTYQFRNGLLLNHYSEHFRDMHDSLDCYAHGLDGHAEMRYWGKSWIRSNKKPYRGGEANSLYTDGIKRNLDTFHEQVMKGDTSNPTALASINSTLMCILGREAAENNGELSWDEMMKKNRKREVDLTGLKS